MNISKLAGVVCGAAFLLATRSALADISITNTGATVNFTGFTAAGFQATPTAGQLSSNDWAVSGFSDGDLNFGGTNANADYTRGTTFPGAGQGGIYAPTSGSVFLGIRLSDADFSPGVITARFKNTGTHKFVQLGIANDLLVYNDGDRVSSISFAWSTDNVTYTTVAGMGQNTPGTAAGTPAWVVTAKSTTITTNIATNGNLYLRWSSDDGTGTGSRDAIGLDNIVITVPDVCGDGVNNGGTEECDDGNASNADACVGMCKIASCGDDFVRTSGANPEQCDGTVCCSNNCTTLTGTTCPGGMCSAGVCVPSGTGGTSASGGEGGDGMAGDTSMAGDTGMGGAGEGGTAAGRGGRTGRGGRGGVAGTDASGGVPAAGTSGAPAAGSAGAPAAGSAGTGGTATAGTSSGGAPAGGKAGSGTGNTGGKAGTSSSGGTGTKPPPSSSSDDDSGCGCSVPRSSNHGTLALVFAGALLTFLRRRRS